MLETFGEFQDIQYRNVISKYVRISKDQMKPTFEGFLQEVAQAYTIKGPFFYSINSKIEEEKDILMELFIPVNEDYQEGKLPEDFGYKSYFQVLNTVATRTEGTSDLNISMAIQRLVDYISYHAYIELTPPFFFVTRKGDQVYTDIQVGVAKD